GQLEEVKSLEPPTLEFIVPLEPQVELGDYRSIRIPFEATVISEEDVYESIERLQSQHLTVKEVEEPAAEKNIVDTKVSGRVANAAPDDENAQIMINQPLPVLIKSEGEDNSNEWPFPGFSRQLLGVSAGETLELVHEHADDESVAEDTRGKEVIYTVTVEDVQSRIFPELTDEFIQSVTDFETKEELINSTRDELKENAQYDDREEYIEKILDAILEDSTVKFPQQMVEDEAEAKVKQLTENLESQGLKLEVVLRMQNKKESELLEDMTESAEHQIPRTLLLKEIIGKENLNVSTENAIKEYHDILDQSFEEGSEERKNFESSMNALQLLDSISSNMISTTALNFLQASAKGEDVSPFLKPEEEEVEAEEEHEDEDEVQDAGEEDDAEETVSTPSDAQDEPEDEEEAEDQA
ncbi:MAG: hypothetical protein U9O54_04440, partial [Chloroflexota bacterium]|nr:hypothetical protein [Chloroflexota bacterium]